jgi:hydroxymethylpyrimidine pyrophosphatase-like HAD family hydrolase
VKPRVLALDLDGTIAVNDTIDLDVTAAIEEARHAGYWPYSLPGEP